MKFAWLRMEIREKQSFYTMMEPSIEHYCEVKSEQILISLNCCVTIVVTDINISKGDCCLLPKQKGKGCWCVVVVVAGLRRSKVLEALAEQLLWQRYWRNLIYSLMVAQGQRPLRLVDDLRWLSQQQTCLCWLQLVDGGCLAQKVLRLEFRGARSVLEDEHANFIQILSKTIQH